MPETAEPQELPILSVNRSRIRIQKHDSVCVLTEKEAASLMAELFDYFEKLVSKKRRKSAR
jgi:hypothetical protein